MATALTSDRTRAVALFHALSDDIRLEVLELLRNGEQCVCELTQALDITQPRLSWHLRTLKDAGLVSDRRQGRWIYYALEPDALAEAEARLGALKPNPRRLRTRPGCC